MAQTMNFPCPSCGMPYQLTAEYLAQYGGQVTSCTGCQQTFTLPTSAALGGAPGGPPPVPPQVLAYSSPQIAPQQMFGGVWREGKVLVATNGAALPPCCVKCNEPVSETMKRKTYYWHPPFVYVGLLAGLLPYAILALVLRKKGTIQFGLCPRHKSRRLWNVLGGVGALILAIVLFVIAGQTDSSTSAALVPVGILLLLVGIIWAALAARTLSPTKIDDRTLWLRGAGPKLLDSLPNGPSYPAWGAPGAYQPPRYAPR